MVGRYEGDTICLISPTWGGLIALNVEDGKDLMRLYWEEAPAKADCAITARCSVTQLDDDEKPEFVILAHSISQHIDVIAPWRGSPGRPQRAGITLACTGCADGRSRLVFR